MVEAQPIRFEAVKPGQLVRVHQRIKETNTKGEEKDRIQLFEGTVLARRGKTYHDSTITVRKVSNGIGVERIFPLAAPTVAEIEIVKTFRVRRAKLGYLRTYRKKLNEVAKAK